MVEDVDRKLLAEAQAGSIDAFGTLFESMRPMIYRVVVRLVGESDAYDVTMTVFLKAWQSLRSFQGRSSLRTWLYRVAYHAALDHCRGRKLRQVPAQDARDDAPAEREIADDRQKQPSELVADAESARNVRAAMDRLTVEHRAALLLRYMEDLSYLEIASALGISLGTVMSRLFNARRRLRDVLEKEFKGV